MPAGSHLDKTLTALAGEFSVAAQLCLRGFVASLTLKNYPEVDIFVFNPADQRHATIEVKTIKGGKDYFLPEHISPIAPTFVFVRFVDGSPEFYVVPAAAAEAMSTEARDHFLANHPGVNPQQPRMISIGAMSEYRDAWDHIAFR